MTPRTRIVAVVTVAALLAVAAAVLAARAGQHDAHGPKLPAGPPHLYLDLGLRTDAEAQALRRAAQLYAKGDLDAAHALFSRFASVQAEVGDAFAGWPAGTLARLRGLAAQDGGSSFVQLHLGLALLWSGQDTAALAALQRANRLQPDSASASVAADLLHPKMVPGLPGTLFAPSFATPPAIAALPEARALAALRARMQRGDAHAAILTAIALARLGHRVSAERAGRAAARFAPNDPEALTAAAVFRFDKDRPARAFGELGPLTKRFPHAATVRFHLGVLLLWIEQVKQAKVELRLAITDDPGSQLALQARQVLDKLK